MQASWPEDFGLIARQRRLDRKISQDELARRVGVTRQWLSRFESAKTDVSLAKALLVLRELDLRVGVSRMRAIEPTSSLASVEGLAAMSETERVDVITRSIGSTTGVSATTRAALETLVKNPSYVEAFERLGLTRRPSSATEASANGQHDSQT